MSCYILTNELISKIAYGVLSGPSPRYPEKIKPETLAKQLHDMNCSAYEARYGETPDEHVFSYKHSIPLTNLALVKALNCFLCQCDEGNIPQTKLFNDIRQAHYFIALDIIESQPGYMSINL